MGEKKLNVLNGKAMHQMSDEELKKVIADRRTEMMTLVGLSKGKGELPKSAHAIRENKRMIARAMTILNERKVRV